MGEGDRLGQQVGNYRLERLLGSGGFADVYLGRQVYLDSQAAIKLLRASLTQEEVEDFRQEARTLARLIHPHIVRILDFGLQGNAPFLVMDYAPNGTLRQRHRRGERLLLATVVEYVKQVASALQYAHNAKIVHRDIKPENMLLGRQNEILIADFGIAIVAQSTRVHFEQEMTGTITYMAPEQIQAHPRPASDQYSLGIVAYEWLSGYAPFHGSFSEVIAKHMAVAPPPLKEYVAGLPPEVEEVIFTALAKDPAQRFASVQAFANALEGASKDARIEQALHVRLPQAETVLALPVSPLPRLAAPAELQQDQPSGNATLLATPGVRQPAALPAAEQAPTLSDPPTRSPDPLTAAPPLPARQAGAVRRGLSRRALLITGLSAAGAVAAGGIAWTLISHTTSSSSAPAAAGVFAPAARVQSPTAASMLLAQDTFKRPNQIFWGTAADGLVWGGDANSLNDFSIASRVGQVQRTANGRRLYTAVLGTAHADAEVKTSASLTSFNPSHLGVILRYTDDNNYYKLLFDGAKLTLLRRVGGHNTTLQNMSFPGQGGTLYGLRFRVVGSELRAKVWQAADIEPADWMVVATDSTFQTGRAGLRPQLDQNVTLRVTLFQETRARRR